MARSLDHQIIAYARALIADTDHWTQGQYARNKRGRKVAPESPRAYRFCAVGALRRAEHDLKIVPTLDVVLANVMQRKIEHFAQWSRHQSLEDFNDERTEHRHQDVLDLFDRYLAA